MGCTPWLDNHCSRALRYLPALLQLNSRLLSVLPAWYPSKRGMTPAEIEVWYKVCSKCSSFARCRTLHHQDEGHILLLQYLKQCNIYRLTHSVSELSGFTCMSSLTMNEKFQYCTRPPSGVWPGGGGGTPIWNRRGCSSEILNLTPWGDQSGHGLSKFWPLKETV